MRKLITCLFVLTSFGVSSTVSDDCSNSKTLEELFDESPHVAIIEVTQIEINSSLNLNEYLRTKDEDSSTRKFTSGKATLVEPLKGEPKAELHTTGAIKGDKCYVPQVKGQRYLVFLGTPYIAPFLKQYATININDVPESLLRRWREQSANTIDGNPSS